MRRRFEIVLDPAIPEEQDAITKLELLMQRNAIRSPGAAAKMLLLDCIIGYLALAYSDLAKRQQHIASLLLSEKPQSDTPIFSAVEEIAIDDDSAFSLPSPSQGFSI